MIAEAIIRFLTALVEFVIELMPSGNPPGWVQDAAGSLGTVWSYSAGLGAWIPFNVVGPVFASVITCMGLGLAIKLTRIVVSLFTAGGGSAA